MTAEINCHGSIPQTADSLFPAPDKRAAPAVFMPLNDTLRRVGPAGKPVIY
jgi:hypothetical protein